MMLMLFPFGRNSSIARGQLVGACSFSDPRYFHRTLSLCWLRIVKYQYPQRDSLRGEYD